MPEQDVKRDKYGNRIKEEPQEAEGAEFAIDVDESDIFEGEREDGALGKIKSFFSGKGRERIGFKPWRHLRIMAWQSLLLAVLFSLLITLISLQLQSDYTTTVWESIEAVPIRFLYNFLPPLALVLLFSFVFNNVFFSAALVFLVVESLSYANCVKVILRNDPIVFQDLRQIREAFYAVADFHVPVNYLAVWLILVVCAIFCMFGLVVWNAQISGKVRAVLSVVMLIVCLVGEHGIYNADYRPAKVIHYDVMLPDNNVSQAERVSQTGFIYSFLYSRNAYGFQKPENYSLSRAEDYEENFVPRKKDESRPHVVMVMCEAFSDISNAEIFGYSQDDENDPLKNFKRLAAEEKSVSGHIVVPNVNAGTANTEFDVMTGVSTKQLAENAIPFFSIRKDTKSIASVMKDDGYHTVFTHPGRAWYYNRQNVYDYFGFDDLSFYDDYDTEDLYDRLVSDEMVGDRIIEGFEKHLEDSYSPLLSFAVTIENHMPYTVDRYGRDSDAEVEYPPFVRGVSKETADTIGIYLEGVRAGDELLGRLADYFEEREEPVVLVFWGDHLPALGDDFSIFRELGLGVGEIDKPEDILLTYETPYLIWENEAAAESFDFSTYGDKHSVSDINANYMGAMLLDMIGLGKADAYFSYLNEARDVLPVYWGKIAVRAEGKRSTLTETALLDSRRREILEKLENWGYYRIMS